MSIGGGADGGRGRERACRTGPGQGQTTMDRNTSDQRKAPRVRRRGFLLLVVIGILAVMLALCLGFLSYTRAELGAVSHLRDKADTFDIADSATDYLIANIADFVIDPATSQYRTDRYISRSLGADGHWWMRPLEHGIEKSPDWYPDNWKIDIGSWKVGGRNFSDYEAKWIYLPDDYFPGGGVRGRFSLLVADTNSKININNWGENCMPTQCQMTHMAMDAGGMQYTETMRGAFCGLYPAWSGDQMWWEPMQLERYKDCFNIATRTTRYSSAGFLCPNRVTTNTTTYQSNWLNMMCFGPFRAEEGVPASPPSRGNGLWGFYDDVVMDSFYWQSYIDPDTGRSPVNVNTVDNNYKTTWNEYGHTSFPNVLQAVFNVESLRRIVKVGKFYFRNNTLPGTLIPNPNDNSPIAQLDIDNAYSEMDAANLYDDNFIANDPTFNANFNPSPSITISALLDPHLQQTTTLATKQDVAKAMRLFVEMLKTRLAFQYQQTMCRYFQGTYPIRPQCHGLYMYFPEVPFDWDVWGSPPGQNRTYYNVYTAPVGAMDGSEVNRVKFAVQKVDDSQARFPVGILQFRDQVRQDLIAMTVNNNQSASPAWQGDVYLGAAHDGGETVCFGRPVVRGGAYHNIWRNYLQTWYTFNGIPEILPGKLDRRTASAIYDNIIPGKVYLFPGEVNPEIKDPLGQLYKAGWGRDENQKNDYNYFGLIPFDSTQMAGNPPGGTVGSTDVGKDINTNTNGGPVPQRQLTFGPDWFSTELTVATTSFVAIVNAQLVDADSAKKDPDNPRVLFHHQRQVVFEIAPDILVEDKGGDGTLDGNGDGTPNGLHYYREDMPRKRKTDPQVMDLNCNTLPQDYRYDTNLKIPVSSTDTTKPPTSVPRDWIDYRGVAPADEKSYYSGGAGGNSPQTTTRVIIRSYWSLNNP